MLWSAYAFGTRSYYASGMDALVTIRPDARNAARTTAKARWHAMTHIKKLRKHCVQSGSMQWVRNAELGLEAGSLTQEYAFREGSPKKKRVSLHVFRRRHSMPYPLCNSQPISCFRAFKKSVFLWFLRVPHCRPPAATYRKTYTKTRCHLTKKLRVVRTPVTFC